VHRRCRSLELRRQGQLFNTDRSIPSTAAHPGNGMLFIDWNLPPPNMTKNAEYTRLSGAYIYAGLMAYKKLVADYPFLDVAP
jgi:hypothetical protein